MKLKRIAPALFVAMFVSAALCAASGGGEGGGPGFLSMKLVFLSINFAIFAGMLYFLLKNPLKAYLVERRAVIEKALAAAQQAKSEADAKYDEYMTRLKNIDTEISRIKKDAEESSALEKERLARETERMVEFIKREAGLVAGEEVRKANARIREEIARTAMKVAEELVRKNINDEDRRKFLADYIDTLKTTRL
jgi:F-type H+-transporting ATPase subunit b